MSAELIHIASKVFNTPWAILPSTFESICEVVQRRMRGERLTADQLRHTVGAFDDDEPRRPLKPAMQQVTLLPVTGIIGYRASLVEDSSSGVGTSVELLSKWFDDAMRNPDVQAVVFDVDSPGGSVEGLEELSAQIFKARGVKPTIAVANGMAASAAYYIASSAETFAVAPSGMVGSIGTLMSHIDISKHDEMQGVKETLIFAGKFKVEGSPLEPLGDEARAEFQRVVDRYYGQFVGDVARNRGVSAQAVLDGYGQGRMLMADEALAAGMVDRVATLDDILVGLGAKPAAVAAGQYDALDLRRKRAALRQRAVPQL